MNTTLTADVGYRTRRGIVVRRPIPHGPHQEVGPAPLRPRERGFRVGIGLMVVSFGNFALFGIIPFLPVSSEMKAGIAVIGWAMSWLLFVIGSLLAGNEGYSYLKQLFRRWFPKA